MCIRCSGDDEMSSQDGILKAFDNTPAEGEMLHLSSYFHRYRSDYCSLFLDNNGTNNNNNSNNTKFGDIVLVMPSWW